MLYDSFPYISPWFRETNKIQNKQRSRNCHREIEHFHFDRNGTNFRVPTARPSSSIEECQLDVMTQWFVNLLVCCVNFPTTLQQCETTIRRTVYSFAERLDGDNVLVTMRITAEHSPTSSISFELRIVLCCFHLCHLSVARPEGHYLLKIHFCGCARAYSTRSFATQKLHYNDVNTHVI